MAVLVQQSTTGALGKLCWYTRIIKKHSVGCVILLEHPVGCFGRAQYYRNTREAVLVQQSTIGALRSLGWYSRIL